MTHRLSDSTIKEINEFFVEQNYTKTTSLWMFGKQMK